MLNKVRYTGCSAAQATYGHGDDPREYLVEGEVYTLKRTKVSGWHTLYTLEGYGVGNTKLGNRRFNSVCFEDIPTTI